MTVPSLRLQYASPDPAEIMPFPSWEAVQSHLQALAAALPQTVRLEEAGRSVGGRPVYLLTVTDAAVPDSDKLVVLAIAQEHGEERSGSLALLEFLEWLLSPEGAPVRASHIVGLMPLVNPDAWESRAFCNLAGVNLFADYTLDQPCSQPEAEAVRQALERLQPEVLANLHGRSTGSAIRAVEGSGLAYATSQFERSHARQFVEQLALAAEAAGYPQDRAEEDAERIVSWIPGAEHQCFGSMHGITPGVYAYHRFHTLSVCMEVQEPPSGVARMRRLLQLGGERWRTEPRAGYPVNVMAWDCHGFLCAAGKDAAQLRASRHELWARQGHCFFAYGVPARLGFDVLAFSPSPDDRQRWSERPLSAVLQDLVADPEMDVPAMRAFAQGSDQGSADPMLLATEARGKPLPERATVPPVRQPLGLRARLVGQPEVLAVLVNGRPLSPGRVDGYEVWDTPNGFRMVQANVTPRGSGRALMMVRWAGPGTPDTPVGL